MGDALLAREAYRAESWAMVIQECGASGLSNREFCRQRGISEKSFYYWLRKFRSQATETAIPQLVQLEPGFDTGKSEELCIQYRGAELRLPAGVDIDAVSSLLRSIQSL